jgi:pimeloyl-ACP methyl ester carboxylesterase
MSERPAFLAIPGLGLRAESWAPTCEALDDNRTTLVQPLPGYGRPAPTGTDLHPRAQAVHLSGRIQPGLGRTVVFGHSASCQIAAQLAALDPSSVAGLVLVGPTTDPRAATWPRLAARWLATAAHETPRQVPSLIRQYRRTTLRGMFRAMDVARTDSIRDSLRQASVPVLVIRGVHDRICPHDWAQAVAGCGGRGSRGVTLPVGGHMVPLTHGSLVAEEIRAFVAHRVEPPLP